MSRAQATADDPNTVVFICLSHLDPVERVVRRDDPEAPRECPVCAERTARRALQVPSQATL